MNVAWCVVGLLAIFRQSTLPTTNIALVGEYLEDKPLDGPQLSNAMLVGERVAFSFVTKMVQPKYLNVQHLCVCVCAAYSGGRDHKNVGSECQFTYSWFGGVCQIPKEFNSTRSD